MPRGNAKETNVDYHVPACIPGIILHTVIYFHPYYQLLVQDSFISQENEFNDLFFPDSALLVHLLNLFPHSDLLKHNHEKHLNKE